MQLTENKYGLIGAVLIGATFAFGTGACTDPILAAVTAMAIVSGAGMLLLVAYTLGLAVPFVLTALFVSVFFRSMRVVLKYLRAVEIFAGILMLAMAVLLATDKLSLVTGLVTGDRWMAFLGNLEDWVTRLASRGAH